MREEKFNLSNSFKITTDMEATARTMTDDIRSLNGISDAYVDISQNTITVDYDETKISSQEIRKKLKELNYLD